MPHTPTHAVVWLDHREAKVFLITADDVERERIKAHAPHRQVHHKANEIGSGHAAPDKAFYTDVTKALADAGEVLIIGPASAKTELASHIRAHAPDIAKRIVAVEAADHPSDNEIVAYAKRHFKLPLPRVQAPG